MGLLLSLLFFSNVPLPSIPEPLITASVLTWTATVHHINVSFDQADVWESFFFSCKLTCLRHSDSFHLTMCMCVHAKKTKKVMCISHHFDMSYLCACWTCLCGKRCAWSSEQNEVGKRKQPDKSAFVSRANPGSGLPTGKQGYNMCIRPHNIIYNRQTHFHTNGFHHRGSPISIKGERL